ncbi:hypothetical protein [Micromonospora sp. I033]
MGFAFMRNTTGPNPPLTVFVDRGSDASKALPGTTTTVAVKVTFG